MPCGTREARVIINSCMTQTGLHGNAAGQYSMGAHPVTINIGYKE